MIKIVYNLDSREKASDWVRRKIKGLKTYDAPQISSALRIKQKGRGKLVDNALGYMVNTGNAIYKNGTDVFILSGTASMANGFSIIHENFEEVVTLFNARKSIKQNYLNDKDEYLAPEII